MPRHVAFLRAINVGGHTVTMDRLRRLFEGLGHSQVETFIASGNVLFDSPSRGPKALEREIARRLEEALGYEVATFIRSPAELSAIVRYEPFQVEEGHGLYVVFAADAPSAAAAKKLKSASGAMDEIRVRGREIYWLRRGRYTESEFSGPRLERTLGMPVTIRNVTTVRKIAAKFS